MKKQSARIKAFHLSLSLSCLFMLLVDSNCLAGEQLGDIWDPAKYISIDEVKPGMEAYCLTCYKGTEVEKFGLEVLDIVRKANPGMGSRSRDVILVQGTDERFIHTGPVGGCSGSPVYIDGRLAGALAFAWTFSKDPLYGVTPIEEMLKVGQNVSEREEADLRGRAGEVGFVFDFSEPIDFTDVNKQILYTHHSERNNLSGLTALPCPLIVSGLPAETCGQLDALSAPFGFMAVAGGSSAGEMNEDQSKVQLVPGASLAIPLLTGDITITALGTATEVVDDKVYGFGHWLLGYGEIELPMATAKIHTVISNVVRSSKLGSQLDIVGALTQDESTAVYGEIGATAKMIPLTINVKHFNEAIPHSYNCRIVDNTVLTPTYLGPVIEGAALMPGSLPPHHMIDYKVAVSLEGFTPIRYENISTEVGMEEMVRESVGTVALLMNNPYKQAEIESLNFDVTIEPKSVLSHVWSVNVSDSKVKPGEEIEVEAVVESFQAAKKLYKFSLTVPDQLPPGKYELVVCGTYEYERFLRKAVPYRFIAQNMPRLVDALKELLGLKRDKLYCLLVLPPGGVTVEGAELPDLPATKALVLQDAARALRTQPYSQWLEKSVSVGTVVIDKKIVHMTVEKQ